MTSFEDNRIKVNKKMCMDEKYIFRTNTLFFDDSENKDEWQDEVYLKARNLSEEGKLYKIFDFGSGSGFKSIKYFSEDKYKVFMYDFKKTIDFAKEKYENKKNLEFISVESGFDELIECDIIIMADVIEHVIKPNDLIDIILKNINFKYLIISTPDRSFLHDENSEHYYGPPINPHHIREWNFGEFKNYFFNNFKYLEILEHYICSKSQGCQLIVLKNNNL